MKALLVHNRYRERGGEDRAVEADATLLGQRGHDVLRYEEDNRTITGGGPGLALRTVWSRQSYRRVRRLLAEERPDVVHCHNTLPLISPSVYYAARAEAVPVVQTLHNYRLICPSALLLREGRPCEDCVGRSVAWPAVRHACYRDSRAASASVASMLATHRLAGTWQRAVHAYVALTQFARGKALAGGLPADRLHVRPNFLATDPQPGDGAGGYALFVGRLSPEKGVGLLLEAWQRPGLGDRFPLRIVGDGPLAESVRDAGPGVAWLGARSPDEVRREMQGARLLVLPSVWYEVLPLVLVEALGVGTPILASDGGSLAELVRPGETGDLFARGQVDALARQATELLATPGRLEGMRGACREAFASDYGADVAYERLMTIYRAAERAATSSTRIGTGSSPRRTPSA